MNGETESAPCFSFPRIHSYGNTVGGHYVWYVTGVYQDTVSPGEVKYSSATFACNESPQSTVDDWNDDPSHRRF